MLMYLGPSKIESQNEIDMIKINIKHKAMFILIIKDYM